MKTPTLTKEEEKVAGEFIELMKKNYFYGMNIGTENTVKEFLNKAIATLKHNAVKVERKHLKRANELLRSAYHIAVKEGKNTNWEAFIKKAEEELLEQHIILNPNHNE